MVFKPTLAIQFLAPLLSQVQSAVIYHHVSRLISKHEYLVSLPFLILSILVSWYETSRKRPNLTLIEFLKEPTVSITLLLVLIVLA